MYVLGFLRVDCPVSRSKQVCAGQPWRAQKATSGGLPARAWTPVGFAKEAKRSVDSMSNNSEDERNRNLEMHGEGSDESEPTNEHAAFAARRTRRCHAG